MDGRMDGWIDVSAYESSGGQEQTWAPFRVSWVIFVALSSLSTESGRLGPCAHGLLLYLLVTSLPSLRGPSPQPAGSLSPQFLTPSLPSGLLGPICPSL